MNGKPYRDLPAPLHEIGAMLEARAIHTGRSAYHHLMAMAQTHGIGRARVQEVIALVGLSEVARKRAGGFSLGMGQRLGIAAALLGDPATHLMAEMAQTAEHLVVIGRGRLIADTTVADVLAQASQYAAVMVRTPQAGELRDVLLADGVTVQSAEREVLEVHGLTSAQVGTTAARHGIVLHELISQKASLEEAFMRLTGGAVRVSDGIVRSGRRRADPGRSMSAATSSATQPTARTGSGAGRVRLARVLRSEWTKLWTLRSTRWSLLASC